MRSLLSLLLCIAALSVQAQFTSQPALQVYALANGQTIVADSSGVILGTYATPTVSVTESNPYVQLTIGNQLSRYLLPANLRKQNGSPYSIVSVSAAVATYLASIPTPGGGGGANDYNALLNKPDLTSKLNVTDTTNFVRKQSGKGLSTNDYTSTEKSKLAGVASGATANSTDAYLLSRGNHTGSIPATVVTQDANNRMLTDAQIGALNAKQAALSSGVNIKSINGQSLLGSGDLAISGGTPADNSITTVKLDSSVRGNLVSVNIDAAKRYGIVADGVCSGTLISGTCVGGTWSGTDNAAKLMLMRSDLAGVGKPAYNIYLPGGGHVLSSNNRWIYGIESVDLFLNGSSIRSIHTGTDEMKARALSTGEMFQNNVLAYNGSKTYASAYLFNTTLPGSTTLALSSVADALAFAAGDRIFLFGYDQIGNGYPPGNRYYEWQLVKAVNITTGVLTLDKPTRHYYSGLWWDVPNIIGAGAAGAVGRPRILIFNKSGQFYARHIGIHGGTLGDATNGQLGNVVLACDDQVLDNVTTEQGWIWASENNHVLYDKVTFNGNSEMDKLVGDVLYKDCSFKGEIGGGSAVENVVIDNGDLSESLWIGPRKYTVKNARLRGNTIPGLMALSAHPGRYPIKEIELDNLHFAATSAYPHASMIDLGGFESITVSTTAFPTNSIVVPYVNSFADQTSKIVRSVEPGTRLYEQTGAKGGYVTSVTWDGSYNSNQGALVINGTWPPPLIGETWKWSHIKNVIDRNNHTYPSVKRLYGQGGMRWKGNTENGVWKKAKWTQRDFSWAASSNSSYQALLDMRIKSIRISVTKAYSATNASSCKLAITELPAYNDVLIIDLTKTGIRTMDMFDGAKGFQSGDDSKSGTIYASNTAYALNKVVTVLGTPNRVYKAVVAGTSATSGGTPTHTSGTVVDGGVTWQYLGVNSLYNGMQSASLATFNVSGTVAPADIPEFEIEMEWTSFSLPPWLTLLLLLILLGRSRRFAKSYQTERTHRARSAR